LDDIFGFNLFDVHKKYQKVKNYHSQRVRPGADAIKKFTPGLGIPYIGVWTSR